MSELNVRNICKELATVNYKWFKFGISLGIALYKLKEFEKEADPFAAVVDYWLRGNVEDAPRSWRTIVAVLEGKDIGESGLAKDINRKYCQQDNREDDSMMARSVSPVYTDLASTDSTANTVVTESAMEIGENDSCTIDRVLGYVQDVKNVRAFGSVLKLDPGKLDEIDRDRTGVSTINLIVKEWFRMEDMSDSDRWEKLGAALLEPAVHEPGIVRRLRPYLRRGSSKDSAISMMSSSPRSSVGSSVLPLQYQMFYVENIGKNKEECSIQNVLNAIALYSEWYDIGLYLGLHTHELDIIKTSYHPADQKVHLVELWKRLDPGGFTWDKLCRALKQLAGTRLRSASVTSATSLGSVPLSPTSLTHLPLPTTPEEPVIPNLSYFSAQIEPTIPYEQEEVESKVEELKFEFESIQEEMMKVLKAKEITFEDLRRVFSSAGQLNALKSVKIVSGKIDMEYIFNFLNENFAWTFLDFDLLDRIVKRYGSNEVKQLMKRYSEKLSNFRKRTTVSKLFHYWTDPDRPSKYYERHTIIVRLEWDPDKFTLERLEKLRKRTHKLLKDISLSEVGLVLYYVKYGSIILAWVVDNGLVSSFKKAFDKCVQDGVYFKENGIIALEVDGEEFMSMERKLFQVSKEGKVREVESALKNWNQEHHNINEVNEDDKTALILASEMGHSSVVVSLLESGTDIDINYQTEDEKRSALFFAYENEHQDTVRLLLEYGADANLTDKSGMAPSGLPLKKKGFMQKVKNVVKTQFKKLLKKDLWTLSKDGNYEAIKSLLEEGQLDISIKDRSYKDWTPLHYACKNGHFEIVQLLLKNGADIHAKATNNWTALAIACHFNFVRIAYLLLKEGANCNQITQKNFTPIMIVTSNDRTSNDRPEDMEPLARTLLKYGADLEIADERGWTPLMNASDIERVNLVRLYLEYGADVNRRAEKGWTALMSAAKHDAGEIARLLIENGANMELAMIPDPKSRKSALEDDALHVASFMGSANVVKELIGHGSEINKTNADGLTPLMIATNQGNIEVVKSLLKSDALDIDLPHQKTGLPALFIAAKKGHLDIFDILLQHGAKDEVNSIGVSEVARLFKKKDQILARLKKFKLIKKMEVSAPEQSPQAAQMKPPKREMTTATSVEAVSVEPVTVEAVSEQAESITAVPTETKSLTQDMKSGAELTTTAKTISVLPMDTESVTAAQQSTDSVTAIPQVTGSVASVQDTDISAVPQTPAAVSQNTESVAAIPQVTEGVQKHVKMVPAHVQVETTEEAPEVKLEAEVQEHPDDETVEDTSSLYGDGEEDSSEQKQDQEKRGRIQQQSREEYLKQLLKTWDLVYKSYTDRMSVFTSNNGSEYSGKGVKPVDIQQHYREQTA